jgi:hypothetical protein
MRRAAEIVHTEKIRIDTKTGKSKEKEPRLDGTVLIRTALNNCGKHESRMPTATSMYLNSYGGMTGYR